MSNNNAFDQRSKSDRLRRRAYGAKPIASRLRAIKGHAGVERNLVFARSVLLHDAAETFVSTEDFDALTTRDHTSQI